MALEKCCLCCKLRNGVVIFGVFGIIIYLILLIGIVSSNILFEERNSTNIEANAYERSKYDSIPIEWKTTPLFWKFVVLIIVNLIIFILLIVGAIKKNHFLMLPWIVVYSIVTIPFAIATAVFLIAGLPIYGPVYIWWCVCSSYQKIQEEPYIRFDTLSLSHNNLLNK